jgi:predicted nucleotide-binding protein
MVSARDDIKVFLSWSGTRSELVARALYDWLPLVLQSVRPWFSGRDINAGARWRSEIARELEESRFAVICLTPENLGASWLHYEVGALAKSLQSAFLVPYLYGFGPEELPDHPLAQFQAVKADKPDTWKLVRTMNRALGNHGMPEERLETLFNVLWPTFEIRLNQIPDTDPVPQLDGSTQFKSDPAFKNLTSRLSRLEEIIRRLQAIPDEEATSLLTPTPADSVFLVHGHNEGIKETVARFLEKLGTVAVVLQELPNEGRTVIEKFEDFSNVHYAVVLMTADDLGGLAGGSAQSSRARQNVIFELGYFVAKLGRSRVCVLFQDGVETPSDFSGVLYVRLDQEGAWRLKMARELKTAGIKVDLNKAL